MNWLKQTTINFANRLLPMRIRASLFHFAYHIAPHQFRKFSYLYSFAPDMRLGLEDMATRGFKPRCVIDVGAYQGDWSGMARDIWPASSIIMIEPNASKEPRCRHIATTIGATLHETLLGAVDGMEVDFNVMASGSSILNERSPLPRAVERRQLTTLDNLIGEAEWPILLKIDAQGYELEIIKGARRLLQRVEAVLLEVSIIEVNEGAPLIHDVIPFMRELGFVTYDILEIHRRPLDQALNQIDLIFIKEDSCLIADKRHFGN